VALVAGAAVRAGQDPIAHGSEARWLADRSDRAKLNRSLRGWAAYFRHGNSARKFDEIDRYVHERLAIWASAKHRRHGRNWQHRHTAAWCFARHAAPQPHWRPAPICDGWSVAA